MRTRLGASASADRYAMSIRAADAIVSSAPKAMKIFPISEVLSRVELSLCAGTDAWLGDRRLRGGGGGLLQM